MLDQRQLRLLQLMQLEIFDAIDSLCAKHGIRFYLVEGTLLGAVRHNGFIPWDDDIDIAMFREDHDRFLDVAQRELGEDFFIQTWQTDRNYSRYITKVRANGTLCIERSTMGVKMHHGVFVDVFPLDIVDYTKPHTVGVQQAVVKCVNIIKSIKSLSPRMHTSTMRRMVHAILRPAFQIVPDSGLGEVLTSFSRLGERDPAVEGVINFLSGYDWRRQLVPRDVYGDGVFVEFEGRQARAPSGWDTLLRRLYGDYMQLPPISARRGSHRIVHLDFGPKWGPLLEKKLEQ